MKRRQPPVVDEYEGTPARLARFYADEWPVGEHQEAADMWWAARRAWAAETGISPLIADDPTPPDESFRYEGV